MVGRLYEGGAVSSYTGGASYRGGRGREDRGMWKKKGGEGGTSRGQLSGGDGGWEPINVPPVEH